MPNECALSFPEYVCDPLSALKKPSKNNLILYVLFSILVYTESFIEKISCVYWLRIFFNFLVKITFWDAYFSKIYDRGDKILLISYFDSRVYDLDLETRFFLVRNNELSKQIELSPDWMQFNFLTYRLELVDLFKKNYLNIFEVQKINQFLI